MKKVSMTLVALAALVTGPSTHASPFKDTNQAPAASHTRASKGVLIAVATAGSRIVAAGRYGIVVYSDDVGKSWTQASVPVSSTLVALSFPSATEGWAVGHDGMVLATQDGGKSWAERLNGNTAAVLIDDYYRREVAAHPDDAILAEARRQAERLVKEGMDKPFLDVWFSDQQNGYLVGAFGLILRTGDGGKTWLPMMHLVDNPQGFHFNGVRGSGGDVYIAGEQGLFLKLDQAQNRFKVVPVGYPGSFFGLLVSGANIVVFGLQGNALRSRDASATWEPLVTSVRATINNGAFLGNGQMALVTSGGEILLSDDLGAHFSAVSCGMPCYSVTGVDQNILAVAGANGVRTIVMPGNHAAQQLPAPDQSAK